MSEPTEESNAKLDPPSPSLETLAQAAVAPPAPEATVATVSIPLESPLTSDIPFLRPRLRNVPIRYTSFPANIDWDDTKKLLDIFPQPRPLKEFGTRMIPKCLLLDSPTPRDKLIVVNWWRNLSGKQQNQEFTALREIYRAPLRDNSPWYGLPKGVKQPEPIISPQPLPRDIARKPVFAPPPRPPTPPPPELLVNSWYLPRHKKIGAIAKKLLPTNYENRKRPDAIAVLRIYKPTIAAYETITKNPAAAAAAPSMSDMPDDPDLLLFGLSPPPKKKIKMEKKTPADKKARPRVQMATAGDSALLKQVFQSTSEWSKKSIQRQLDLTCALNYNTRIPQLPCDILTNIHQHMELAPPDTIIQQDDSLRFDEFLS